MQIKNYHFSLSESLLQSLLQQSISNLDPGLKSLFDFNDSIELEGKIKLRLFSTMLGRIICIMLNLPTSSGVFKSRLIIEEYNKQQVWYRFIERKLFKTQVYQRGKYFVETSSIFDTYYRIGVNGKKLEFKSIATNIFGFRMPPLLAPKINAFNVIKNRKLNIKVTLDHPIFGRILRYWGIFKIV